MNYENLYEQISSNLKTTKDAVASATKFYKNLNKDLENGDLKDLKKSIEAYEEGIDNQRQCVETIKEIVESFITYFKTFINIRSCN